MSSNSLRSKKQRYVKKDPISHILDRPDMYIGSTIKKKITEFIYGSNGEVVKSDIEIAPGFVRIFVEPLSNIIDNYARSKDTENSMTKIEIEVNEMEGYISMWNDGEIIPIEMHPEEKIYNHTLIFGHLLSSSNYDDTEDRIDISGKNGLGVKCSNVFSKKFVVEGVDPVNKKYFRQEWSNNMRTVSEPEVKPSKSKNGYTKVTFYPDFEKFGIDPNIGFDEDTLRLFKKLTLDCAVLTETPVLYNGERLPVSTIEDYAKMYYPPSIRDTLETVVIETGKEGEKSKVVIVGEEDGESKMISFVNGIYTPLGGVHLNAWTEAIFRPIVQKFNKPKKPQININDVKQFFSLFVMCSVSKPVFESQVKARLESPTPKVEVKKGLLTTLQKWRAYASIEDVVKAKEMTVLKKAERKKRGFEKVNGLEPANKEGGKTGRDCTLIVVEGDSAKTYAVGGIRYGLFGREGQDWNGIFKIRGKILNCRNVKPVTISKNEIISNLIKALGLEYGVDYSVDSNYNKLRYGRLLILTDQDVDGIHISSLIQNNIHAMFPSLLKRDPPFLTSMQTPLVRVFDKGGNILFYDENEFKRWLQDKDPKKVNKKYYKGLGTSKNEDIKETFGRKIVEFEEDEKTGIAMNNAFSNKYTDVRKKWLTTFDSEKNLLKWNGTEHEVQRVKISEFIEYELIKYSIDNCKRSIPHIMDGLKESQRKVLYTVLKRNINYNVKTTMKVAQLAGAVSELTAYHHGEQNLLGTISGMAQAFVGSNNIPLLYRDGQFGSRLAGGKDSASGRYIYTKMEMLTRIIFKKEDDVLLTHNEDDGNPIEPKWYLPIIPMVLINGCLGIGTGWSTFVPCYNPLDIVDAIRIWLENDGKVEEGNISLLPELVPWYRGFTGSISRVSEGVEKFVSEGVMSRDKKDNPVITELPIGVWTNDYLEFLEELMSEKHISSIERNNTTSKVNITIHESRDGLICDKNNLKLTSSISCNNLVLFTNMNGKEVLKKYRNVEEVLIEFCQQRYPYYQLRKDAIVNELKHELLVARNRKRFLEEVRDGEINLYRQVSGKKVSLSGDELSVILTERKYDKVEDGYEYLLSLQIKQMTLEKVKMLSEEITRKEEVLKRVESTSTKEMWMEDLNEFTGSYRKWLLAIEKEEDNGKKRANKDGCRARSRRRFRRGC